MRHLLILSLLMLCSCAASAGRMGGTEWRASDINGVPVVPNSLLTLRLGDGKSVSGSAGCNIFSGQYRMMSKEGIRFSALRATEKACTPDLMDQEQRYLSILQAVEGYSFYGDGGLSLISPDGRAIRFRR